MAGSEKPAEKDTGHTRIPATPADRSGSPGLTDRIWGGQEAGGEGSNLKDQDRSTESDNEMQDNSPSGSKVNSETPDDSPGEGSNLKDQDRSTESDNEMQDGSESGNEMQDNSPSCSKVNSETPDDSPGDSKVDSQMQDSSLVPGQCVPEPEGQVESSKPGSEPVQLAIDLTDSKLSAMTMLCRLLLADTHMSTCPDSPQDGLQADPAPVVDSYKPVERVDSTPKDNFGFQLELHEGMGEIDADEEIQ